MWQRNKDNSNLKLLELCDKNTKKLTYVKRNSKICRDLPKYKKVKLSQKFKMEESY